MNVTEEDIALWKNELQLLASVASRVPAQCKQFRISPAGRYVVSRAGAVVYDGNDLGAAIEAYN